MKSLQLVIRPPPLSPVPTSTSSNQASSTRPKDFDITPGSKGYASFGEAVASEAYTEYWSRFAHVQLVRGHLDVCNAVMLFRELFLQQSPAQKLLLYPKVWNDVVAGTTSSDLAIETSMRILRLAAEDFGVSVLPIDPTEFSSDGGNAPFIS